jgi:two-component system KDP operon response regulator KdpE
MTRVLVVDDEDQILKTLRTNLKARGYEVHTASDGESALALAARHHPDVVILDLGLPGMDGLEVINGLRGWTEVPIIVTKPFGMDELLARLRAAVRRGAPPKSESPVVETAHFSVDLSAKKTRVNGNDVRLTPTEWHLVELLVRSPGKLLSQGLLLKEVWGPQYSEETDYLRVYMAQIRRKLEPDPAHPRYFITEPGMGYRFEPEAK